MILVWKQTKLPVLKFSPLDLLEDAEDLMFDTRKRRGPCVDLESSLEIGPKDLILAKKIRKSSRNYYSSLIKNHYYVLFRILVLTLDENCD